MSVAVSAADPVDEPRKREDGPQLGDDQTPEQRRLPKIVCTSCGLPDTFQATAPVRQSPPVIQPYTRLMNRAFSAAIEAGPKA